MDNRQSSGVDVILDYDESPTLLFERKNAAGEKGGSRFYACSACRDRKECSFFQWQRNGKTIKGSTPLPPALKRDELYNRLECFRSLAVEDRTFCFDCSKVLMINDLDLHKGHRLKRNVKLAALRQPSALLPCLDNNKTNAQYFFSDESIEMTLNIIEKMGYDRVICIGAPRIHERLIMKRKSNPDYKCKSLLLDLDSRFANFHSSERYLHYNLFNHHFFEGDEARQTYAKHIASSRSNRVAVVIDPPFGGYVAVIAHTLTRVMEDCRKAAKEPGCLWFFPYFLEKWIMKALPKFNMIHYKVTYDNHVTYSSDSKRGSPVRIFTDIPAKNFVLQDDKFKFCESCDTYVPKKVKHCDKCNSCVCKDGRAYKHCDACSRCVKPSYRHCDTCKLCHLEGSCIGDKDECHICKSKDHKRRECPIRHNKNRRNAIKRKYGAGGGGGGSSGKADAASKQTKNE